MGKAGRRSHTDPLFANLRIIKFFDMVQMENLLFIINSLIMNSQATLKM